MGDLGILLKVIGAWDHDGRTQEFCMRNSLRYYAMREIAKLRQQITNIGILIYPTIVII